MKRDRKEVIKGKICIMHIVQRVVSFPVFARVSYAIGDAGVAYQDAAPPPPPPPIRASTPPVCMTDALSPPPRVIGHRIGFTPLKTGTRLVKVHLFQ